VVALVGLLLLLIGCSPEQQAALDQINGTRRDAGLTELLPSPHAMEKAQAWATQLAQAGSLRHSGLIDGMPEGWQKLGENVGSGPSLDAVYQGLLQSPAHKANLLDPTYNWAGTGVAVSADGTVYVVQVFAQY
jgi:uncharacterized protein YkwD